MGRSPCCQKEGLKKGPWTPEEDEKLIAYVKEHGHGNWRALPKKCGLLRCGKSCRLRWTNYLRPDIKRGLFTHSEEQKIILLHALVGNKWAFIASQLPKRTDNEIKNFWNTVLRKRLQHKQSFMISTSTELQSPAGQTNDLLKQGNKKSSPSSSNRSNSSTMQQQSAGMKSSINTSRTSSMQQGINKSSSHLAQWESARLEAEARLAKESQSSKTLKLLSLNLGSFSASTTTTTTGGPFTNTATTTTTTTDAPFTTATTTTSVAPSLTTTTPFTSFSTTQYPSDHHYPCTIAHFLSHTSYPSMICPSPSATNPSSSPLLSSASMISLSSQARISSALTLRPNGRLCWKTQELAFTSYASSQKNRNRSIKLDMDNQESADKDAGAIREDMEPEEGDHYGGDKEEQEILNSMMSCLPSGDNWQDLLFDGCSDHEVSTAAWRSQLEMIEPISTSHIIINDHDVETDIATLLISNNNLGLIQCSPMHVPHVPSEAHAKLSHHHHHHHHQKHAPDHASYMDLDGITLSHIDSLLCDYTANQHKSGVLKEIWRDTPPPIPTPLSISS